VPERRLGGHLLGDRNPGTDPGGGVAIVFTPDSRTAYVMTYHGVAPVSLRAGKAGSLIKAFAPYAIAITKDGRTVYVVNFAHAYTTGQGSVVPISTATNTAGKEILVGGNPGALAITPPPCHR
jgi:DNA-binding beta-propeller fold protein YncE